jgi:hypothetical protein
MIFGQRLGVAIALALQLVACRAKPDEAATRAAGLRDQPVEAARAAVFPHARWRLATFDELGRTTIWLHHIVIRHDRSDARWFRRIAWAPDPESPKRTRAEALARATRLARTAGASPAEFEDLARRYSEDVITAARGGELGGVRANQLHPEFLDVLATLRPGQVSPAFETPYGFHVIRRDLPPADEQVSGRRIVVAYEGTVGGTGRNFGRSRQEARAVADRVAALVRTRSFEDLVVEYSDAPPSVPPGDMGTYSRIDPEFLPQEVEVLANLKPGEVSEPFDSRFGYQLLQRTEAIPRRVYAMEYVQLKFDPNLDPSDPRSQARVAAKAERLAIQISHRPEAFDELRNEICCNKVWRWSAGRGPQEVSQQLDALNWGEVAPRPIQHDWFFLIAKRLDPAGLPPEPLPRDDLPQPERPDYEALIEFNSAETLGAIAADFAKEAQRGLAWSIADKEVLSAVLSDLGRTLRGIEMESLAARRASFGAARDNLKRRLGKTQYEDLVTFANAWAVGKMLR